MDVQNVVSTVGPWVAAAAGLLTALTAIRGAFGTRRMRADLTATAELLDALPSPGAERAREALDDLLAIQADRMRARGRDGVQFSERQSVIIANGFVLVIMLVLTVLFGAVWEMDNQGGIVFPEWARQVAFYSFLVSLALSMVLVASLVVFVLSGVEAWLKARTRDAGADQQKVPPATLGESSTDPDQH